MKSVIVSTAHPLSESNKKSLLAALKKKFGAEVQMEEKIDTSLIGGMQVRIGSKLIDSSIKSKLAKIESHLLEIAK